MKVYFHFQVQNRKLFTSLLTGHSLQGIFYSILNKSKKSKIHKFNFNTLNMAFIQKHKYIKLQKEGSFFGLKIISYNKQHNQENKKKEKKK